MEPSGKDGCAAVAPYMSKISPVAVNCPSKSLPYQLAEHSQIFIGFRVVYAEDSAEGNCLGSGVPELSDGTKANKLSAKNTDSTMTNFLRLIFPSPISTD